MPSIEKRKHKRLAFNLKTEICRVADIEKEDGKYVDSTCRDISDGGLSFYSSEEYKRGDIVRSKVILPESRWRTEGEEKTDTILFLAKVIYSRFIPTNECTLTGIEFLNIYQQDYDILCSYLVEVMAEKTSFGVTSPSLCLSKKSSVKQIN